MAKRYNDGSYAGMDARRAQENRDGSMIAEDRSSIANMPQNVIMKEYPGYAEGMQDIAPDDIRGVNMQMNSDHSGMRRYMKPKKV